MKLNENRLFLFRLLSLVLVIVSLSIIAISYHDHPMFGVTIHQTIAYSAIGLIWLQCLIAPQYFSNILPNRQNQAYYPHYRLVGCIGILLVISRLIHIWN